MTCDADMRWIYSCLVCESTPTVDKICALCREGASLYEILKAGEWSSPAFLSYLDLHSLEKDAVIQAHVDESDEEAGA